MNRDKILRLKRIESMENYKQEVEEILLNLNSMVHEKSYKKIKFVKLNDLAIIPKKATRKDMGMDIWSDEKETVIIKPCSKYMFKTGIASIIPENFGLLVADRSSMGSKGIHYAGGVVDEEYRGEIRIILTNINSDKMVVVTNQDKDFVEKCEYFDLKTKKFVLEEPEHKSVLEYSVLKKEVLVIKYLKDAIAQLLLVKNEDLPIEEGTMEELQESKKDNERRENGFGHSNAQN